MFTDPAGLVVVVIGEHVDQPVPGFCRFNDIVYIEDSGRTPGFRIFCHDPHQFVELIRIIFFFEVIHNVDPCFRGHKADFRRRPCHNCIRVTTATHIQESLSISFSYDYGNFGNRYQRQRVHEVNDLTGDFAPFTLLADHKSGGVHQHDNRYVKGVAQHQETGDLFTGIGI